jgi:hypothetical protein
VSVVERHEAIVEEVGSGNRRLAVVELGEGELGVGVDEGLLVDAPPATLIAFLRVPSRLNYQLSRPRPADRRYDDRLLPVDGRRLPII